MPMDKWFGKLVDDVRKYLPQLDVKRLSEAYAVSEKIYECLLEEVSSNQEFKKVLIINPKDIIDVIAPFKPDEDTIVAAFLYNVSDCKKFSMKELEDMFGEEIVELINGLHMLRSIPITHYGSTNKLDLLRKLFLVMAKDIRVLIIFLSVKVVQMKFLDDVPGDFRIAFSREVLEVFAPIASRLGIYRIKTILEDYCFKYLDPQNYSYITDYLDSLGEKKSEYIFYVCNVLKEFYEDRGFNGVEVSGRLKGFYSIYNKMGRKNIDSVDDIYDIFAVRVILPTRCNSDNEEDVSHLYEALGLLHGMWKPIPSRFKDYVAVPKPNGYKSLHSTVIGLTNGEMIHPVEVQIRSSTMHDEAEYGIASHWLYKDSSGRALNLLKSHVEWLSNLAALHADIKGDEKALDSLKLDLFGDRIYVLTPKGEVKDLPKGATPLDFAYAVHTEIGNRCILAKVNAKPVSLDMELGNGDTVEIVTRKDSYPKLEWLSIVKTSQAKAKIKSWFASQDSDKNVKRGRDQFNIQLARFGKPLLTPALSILKTIAGENLSFQEREGLLEEIGKGTQSASTMIRKIYGHEDLLSKEREKLLDKRDKKIVPSSISIERRVLLGGLAGLKVKIAKCCNPTLTDEIVGYISALKDYATVHKKSCALIARFNPKRFVEASFDGGGNRGGGGGGNVGSGVGAGEVLYRVKVRIDAEPRVGLLGDIGSTIAANGVNISNYQSFKSDNEKASVEMTLDVGTFEQFEKVLDSVEKVRGVMKITRVN
jgi:GTP pyrophosphokinase